MPRLHGSAEEADRNTVSTGARVIKRVPNFLLRFGVQGSCDYQRHKTSPD
jgi:hypothetical protein